MFVTDLILPMATPKWENKMRVIIKDDTGRVNRYTQVTKANKETLEEILGIPLKLGMFLPVRDDKKRQVQDVVTREMLFEDGHLDWAIKRAKRWLKSNGPSINIPGHLAEKMAAFKAANVEDFIEAIEEGAKAHA